MKLRFDEFINKYINTKVDFDNAFGAQCVDLFRQYCKNVLNIPHTGAVEGAKDIFLDYDKLPLEQKYFKKYSTNNPKPADVIIWNETKTNKYGHIAIVVSNLSNNKVLVFEQDGFKQNGAKLAIRTTENTLGILRFNGENIV